MSLNINHTTRAACLAVGALATLLTASEVRAEDEHREGPLDNAPAIRSRRELRKSRFEIGAGLGTTVGQDFNNSMLVDLKLGYHLVDWLAISGTFGQAVTNISTGTSDRIKGSLAQRAVGEVDARAPSPQEALDGMNSIGTVLGVQGEITPIAGKLSLFGRFFAHYDFYAFGGVGALNMTADGDACPDKPMAYQSCPVVGFKVGPSWGVGFHGFINDMMAINLELRDVLIHNNPAGRDVNADTFADDHDLKWDQNFIFTANLQFFLPRVANISD